MSGGKRKRKRDPSAARADSFAGAKEKKKRRPAPVGMAFFLNVWMVAAVVEQRSHQICCKHLS